MSGYGQNPYAQQDAYNTYGAQQQQSGYGGYDQQVEPYSPLNSGAGYEMGNLNNGGVDDNQAFFDEISHINEGIENLNANIAKIEGLHSRSLKDIDEYNTQQTQRQLEAISAETSSLNQGLVRRIKTLKSKHRDQQQVSVVERKFKESLNKYRQVEKAFADRMREQIARQYRIVKPEATEDEIQQACEDPQGQQIFSSALLNQNRRGEARSALREVQSRHNEIQKIEKTIIELAQLFEEMNQMVVEQEEMVVHIEEQGEQVQHNVEHATKEIETAVDSAHAARRKKWWCLLICILIIIIVVVIAVVVTQVNKSASGN